MISFLVSASAAHLTRVCAACQSKATLLREPQISNHYIDAKELGQIGKKRTKPTCRGYIYHYLEVSLLFLFLFFFFVAASRSVGRSVVSSGASVG
ncbi:hypothetical protein BD289DRAFT_443149 [Coniella lustricola]|uniref:Secreted protein n=1 Tax=Coniella lustricola TaxID=2025994 RepID=A0A2T2ZXH5_9PEZI|nr:hypothetical protein BD289DRAFT_443149 [Coniella lustricola]